MTGIAIAGVVDLTIREGVVYENSFFFKSGEETARKLLFEIGQKNFLGNILTLYHGGGDKIGEHHIKKVIEMYSGPLVGLIDENDNLLPFYRSTAFEFQKTNKSE